MDLTDCRTVSQIMSRFGLSFRKGLGQNFLINPEVPAKTAELAGIDGKTVLEIGPGIGTLTCEIAKRAEKVVCVELDERLLPALSYTLSGLGNVTVVHQDIMKTDFEALSREYCGGGTFSVCANLPYYITTPVMIRLTENKTYFNSVTAMVQSEVARRFAAAPGSPDCGAISLFLQYHADAKVLFDVGRESFVPSPKVDSAVVKLDFYEEPPVSAHKPEFMFRIIRAAFQNRRKTLQNCLKLSGITPLDKERVSAYIKCVCGEENIRGEELGLAEYAELANLLDEDPGL